MVFFCNIKGLILVKIIIATTYKIFSKAKNYVSRRSFLIFLIAQVTCFIVCYVSVMVVAF